MGGKIYPIGIQNFEKLRRGGYFYIDKTALIYQLVKTGSYYILSRPRRFGKSLLISTLEAYFQGKRELFEGLAMEKMEKDWVKYPVLHLDLNTEKYDTPEIQPEAARDRHQNSHHHNVHVYQISESFHLSLPYHNNCVYFTLHQMFVQPQS